MLDWEVLEDRYLSEKMDTHMPLPGPISRQVPDIPGWTARSGEETTPPAVMRPSRRGITVVSAPERTSRPAQAQKEPNQADWSLDQENKVDRSRAEMIL